MVLLSGLHSRLSATHPPVKSNKKQETHQAGKDNDEKASLHNDDSSQIVNRPTPQADGAGPGQGGENSQGRPFYYGKQDSLEGQ